VQSLELILLSAGILLGAAYIGAQFIRRGAADHPVGRLMLGVIPAVTAVAVILIDRLDLIPDDIEQPLWIVAVVLVTLGLIVGTSYRLVGR
jgi:hypothetical protein